MYTCRLPARNSIKTLAKIRDARRKIDHLEGPECFGSVDCCDPSVVQWRTATIDGSRDFLSALFSRFRALLREQTTRPLGYVQKHILLR